MRTLSYAVAMIWLVLSQAALAESNIISIEGATIRGNQELPTVLYLVPWQPAKVHSLERPKQTLASSRSLEPIDRASFLRMQQYYQEFKELNATKRIVK